MAGSAGERQPSTTTTRLLARARTGDGSALGRLLERCLPDLRRWAHGRLPRWTRDGTETADLIQDAVFHTLRRLDTIDVQGRQALGAYLRAAVANHIRDHHRRRERRGLPEQLSEATIDPAPSALDRAMGAETMARYRSALARLRPLDRRLVVAHVELDYSHDQLACMIGRSRNAARMALQRAIRRLAQLMRDG